MTNERATNKCCSAWVELGMWRHGSEKGNSLADAAFANSADQNLGVSDCGGNKFARITILHAIEQSLGSSAEKINTDIGIEEEGGISHASIAFLPNRVHVLRTRVPQG